MKNLRFLISICLLVIPAVSQAWWNDEWQFRKKITLDTTPTSGSEIKGNAAEVPVLIRLHTGNFGFFLDLKPDAGDLRFISSDDKTPLKHHIEKFDPINEMALIWVKVPVINGGVNTNSLWMYYGNAGAAPAEEAAGTFDASQALLLHFGEKDNVPRDATGYNNNPTLSTAEYFTAAIIGNGVQFKGNSLIKAPASPMLQINPEKGWSFSSWIKLATEQSKTILLHQEEGGNSLSVIIDGAAIVVEGKSGAARFQTQKTSNLTMGNWHNLAVIIGSGKISVFIDGAELTSTPALFSAIGGSPQFGALSNGSKAFSGELDEISIAGIARNADFIALQAKGQAAQSNLVKLGEDEQKDAASGGDASYFGIILQNVTLDGWVVIVLLVIMAVISWIVMIGKGMIILRAQKDNAAFIRSFKESANTDPAALDQEETADEKAMGDSPLAEAIFGKHDHFQSSPLYHIYHTGIHEVNSRIGRSVGAQSTGLSALAMDSIRATLDASLVRESQRLNKQMVLLTIAISGGPFLGLLGTVVGVMITFAAIAAAGDVNVNAIAPGIAAALVATVAGLVVAIPALFGYNYIGSRIKEIVADMHVFVDEFLTKVAEHYGRE